MTATGRYKGKHWPIMPRAILMAYAEEQATAKRPKATTGGVGGGVKLAGRDIVIVD